MREFTAEEKELIVNTPIDYGCFDGDMRAVQWYAILEALEYARGVVKEHNGEEPYFTMFVKMIPNSYKVVKL
jgi:hypothetical protein